MICHIYRQKGRRIWRGRYRLHNHTLRHDVSLETADKQVAEQKLKNLMREAEQEAAGILTPKTLRTAAQKPIQDHLEDYLNDLLKLGRSDKHINNVTWRTSKLIKECGWVLPMDVTADSFQTWRAKQTMSAKTINDYLGAASSLMAWMIKQCRISFNPLKSVEKIQTQGRETRHRRAFTDDEIQRLLAAAGERKAVYLTALHTGLRHGELASLEWGDVKLDSDIPSIQARSSTTKNHKPALIPLHPDLVAELTKIKPVDFTADMAVFPRMPRIERLRRDLKKAGVVYKDAQGHVADFHSLRKTFCTNLARYGVPSRVAMALMRHSDRRLTDQIYTDENLLGTRSAIEAVPSFLGGDQRLLSALLSEDVLVHKQQKSSHGLASTSTTSEGDDDAEKAVNKGEMHVLSPTCANISRIQLAGATGLEPATSAVTGQRSKPIELRPHTNCIRFVGQAWWALKDSNL